MRIRSWAVRKRIHPDWQHPRYVRVGLRDCRLRSQPRDSVVSESRENQLRAIELERHDYIEIRIDKSKSPRHHANNFPGPRIHQDVTANHRAVSAEAPLPIRIAQHHSLRTARNLILFGEPAADFRGNAERLEHAVAHVHDAHLLRLG